MRNRSKLICRDRAMKRFVKGVSTGLLLLGQTGCITPAPMTIDGLEFLNAGDLPITDVELRVLGTYEVASCNYIVAHGRFSTRFPLLEYRGNAIRVSWNNRLGSYQFGPLVIPPPAATPEKPVRVVITFQVTGEPVVTFQEKQSTDLKEKYERE